jgi:hypothetical protein
VAADRKYLDALVAAGYTTCASIKYYHGGLITITGSLPEATELKSLLPEMAVKDASIAADAGADVGALSQIAHAAHSALHRQASTLQAGNAASNTPLAAAVLTPSAAAEKERAEANAAAHAK